MLRLTTYNTNYSFTKQRINLILNLQILEWNFGCAEQWRSLGCHILTSPPSRGSLIYRTAEIRTETVLPNGILIKREIMELGRVQYLKKSSQNVTRSVGRNWPVLIIRWAREPSHHFDMYLTPVRDYAVLPLVTYSTCWRPPTSSHVLRVTQAEPYEENDQDKRLLLHVLDLQNEASQQSRVNIFLRLRQGNTQFIEI